jgi:hypothetical protein
MIYILSSCNGVGVGAGAGGGIPKCRLKKSVLILFQILTFFSENLGFFSLVYIQLILLIFAKSHQIFLYHKIEVKKPDYCPLKWKD